MDLEIFHPTNPWPTKDAKVFLVKNLTLVSNNKKECESDLHQGEFLKEYEHV